MDIKIHRIYKDDTPQGYLALVLKEYLKKLV